MDHILASVRSRVNSRTHRHQQYTLTERALPRRAQPHKEEEDPADKLLLLKGHKRRTVMSNSHRRFHRRAPQAEGTGSNVKTVNVEVVATVDTAGNVVAQTTITQPESTASTEVSQALPVTNVESAVPTTSAAAADTAVSTPAVPSVASLPSETQSVVASLSTTALPSVPSVPAVSSVSLPSVPSVPAFPSDLTVPAYPYASSSAASVATDAVAISSSVSSAATSSEPSVVAALNVAGATNSTTSSISASTSSISSSILASSPTLLSTTSGFTYSSSSSVVASSAAISSRAESRSSEFSSSPSTTTSNRATPTASLDAAGSSSFYGSGGAGWTGGSGSATTAAPAGTSAAAAAGGSDSSTTAPLDTPQVVGSVVGSLAGAALVLAIILILLRRHKRRQDGALQLSDSRHTDNEQAMRQVQAPAAARASLVPSAFLNRFSGLSRSTAETSSPTERSFQRVSGRKLPSAFSEGMTSDQVARGGHLSDSSFYQDDQGTYGGPGIFKEYGGDFGKEIGETSVAGAVGKMNVRPSPARTPIIHHPSENPFDDTNRTLSPPMSPNPFSSSADLSPRRALGRSLHSADGSRSSRFTENV